MIDRETLEAILRLSRLDVDEQEKENFQHQVGDILEYFDRLKNYDTSNVNVDLGVAIKPEEIREDVPGKSFTEEELEEFAIHFSENFFNVPKVLENAEEEK